MACQYVALCLFPIVRTLKWSAVSDYVMKHYPMLHFGRLLGCINFAIGVSNLMVYPLTYVCVHAKPKEEYTPVNIALTVAQGLCVMLPVYEWARRRTPGKDKDVPDAGSTN